jgi:hypothetical protein
MLFCRKIVVLKRFKRQNDIEVGKGSVGTQIIRHHRNSGTLYTKLTDLANMLKIFGWENLIKRKDKSKIVNDNIL